MDSTRKEWIEARKSVTNRDEKTEALVARLMPFLRPFERVALYVPVHGEVNVAQLVPLALYPIVQDRDMVFGQSKLFKSNRFGIYEPFRARLQEPEVVVVPVVAFWNTARMGYGQGYYDRWLSAHPDVLSIGVAFDEQEHPFETHAGDQTLDMLITPSRIVTNAKIYERKRKYTELLEPF